MATSWAQRQPAAVCAGGRGRDCGHARENKLAADEAAAKADGKVTRKERARLNHEAHRDSRAIYKQKHDRQKAKPTP
jgi:hypothetical protein